MRYILPFIILLIFAGCSVKHSNSTQNQQHDKNQIKELSIAIANLDETIDKKEAFMVSSIAVQYSKHLAHEYKLVSPPLWHNTLVNMNLKQKGFCYHFAQDILHELKKHPIKTIDLKWVTHKKNDYWEHNAIYVKSKRQQFPQGIVLDAWRNSGELYWNYITKDTSYDWVYDRQKSNYYGN